MTANNGNSNLNHKIIFAAVKLMTVAALSVVANVSHHSVAEASCRANGPTPGTWINVNQRTRGVRRFYLGFECNDFVRIPSDATPAERARLLSQVGPRWTVHLWGKCHPRDCHWGARRAIPMPTNGFQNLVAHYNQGFATRRVVMRKRGNRVQLIMSSRYRDGRASRKTSEWFVLHRAGS